MTVQLEPAEWGSLNGAWTALYDDVQPAAGPFVSPEFLSSWWDVLGGELELDLTAVRDDDELIGVLPLQRSADTVTFLGDFEVCDYMDLLAATGHEAAVVEALLERLDGLEAKRADLRGLAEGSSTLDLLPALAEARGWTVARESEAVCPVVTLPEDWQSYVTGLRRKYRHEVRRKLRNLRSGKAVVDIEVVSDPGTIRERLPEFLRMMTTSRGDKAEFMTERMATFFHTLVDRMAPANHVQMYFLLLDGKRVATVLCFVCHGRLMLYNSGYDPDFRALSVGIASKVFCMREAIDTGLRAVNFLRGDEEYKFQLGAEPSPVTRLILTR